MPSGAGPTGTAVPGWLLATLIGTASLAPTLVIQASFGHKRPKLVTGTIPAVSLTALTG